MPAEPKHVDEEIEVLERTLVELEDATGRLQRVVNGLADFIDTAGTHGLVLMPNYRRGQEQLRIALNASWGAKKSLARRLELRRKVRSRASR